MQARLLESLLADIENLDTGTEYPVLDTRCIFCQQENLTVKPLRGSVEGSPGERNDWWMQCHGCGRGSPGKG